MATVDGSAVQVGDWLRCHTDEWEGRVTAVDADTVTLLMHSGDVRVLPPTDLFWNWWSKRTPDA